jgi:hypothetical protein
MDPRIPPSIIADTAAADYRHQSFSRLAAAIARITSVKPGTWNRR